MSEESLIELSKLRWHCRRGVKELDVVLSRYLDNHYLNATAKHQQAFRELLQIEDPVLMSLVIDDTQTDNELHREVLLKIQNPYGTSE